jgi:3-dehydroquinate synthase
MPDEQPPSTGVRVGLGARSYDILIGAGLLDDAGSHAARLCAGQQAVIVTDDTVAGLYLDRLTATLSAAGVRHRSVTVRPGEASKDFATFERVAEEVLGGGLERRDMVVAFGGGVIGDLAGFVASVVLRGIDFIQIPTTLLAQVDSSVGGKTAINSRHGKNLIGLFHQPRLVLIDTETLSTLPGRELRAGYAEVAKYGLLGDAGFFDWLEENRAGLLAGDDKLRAQAIRICCEAKARLVAEDERETGARALLNLGHTFGHALEAEAGYGDALLHGEAVALGMKLAFDLSARLGLCAEDDAARVTAHLRDAGLPTALSDTPIAAPGDAADRLIAHMWSDKKVAGGKLTFILAEAIGRAVITQDVALDDVRAVLQAAA